MLCVDKRDGEEDMNYEWDWLFFRIGLGAIFIANMILAVIVCYGIYIGAL